MKSLGPCVPQRAPSGGLTGQPSERPQAYSRNDIDEMPAGSWIITLPNPPSTLVGAEPIQNVPVVLTARVAVIGEVFFKLDEKRPSDPSLESW